MRQYTKNRDLKHACDIRFSSEFLKIRSIFDVENELWMLITSSK